MKSGIPWSVKGIEPETREAAKDAARRSGMSLGEWLNTKILDSADGATQDASPAERPNRQRVSRDDTSIRLEDIAEQLSRIARGEQYTAPAQSLYSSQSNSEDSEALRNILNRIENNEQHTAETFSEINDRLSTLSRQLGQVLTSPRPDDGGAVKSLEAAIRNVVEHIEVSETRNRETFKSMQERMGDMVERAAASANEKINRSAPALASLENRLNELFDRVERSESRTDFSLPQSLRDELNEVTERIETVRDSAQHLATKAQTSAVENLQRELRDTEKRILALMNEAKASGAKNNSSDSTVRKLQDELESVGQRLAALQFETAPKSELHALQTAVEQLTTGLAKVPEMPQFVEMDYRITQIIALLEETHFNPPGSPPLEELERKMSELDSRLNDALNQQGGGAPQELEQKIFEISDRVGRTEQQLGSLETIERAIHQLFESVEQSRNSTKNIAEETANRTADRLMSGTDAPTAVSGNSAEFLALQEGLRAVREAAAIADHRNQETMEAVHSTLEQIVTKLAELEVTAQIQQEELSAVNQVRNAAPLPPAAADDWQLQTEIPDQLEPTSTATHEAEAQAEIFQETVQVTPESAPGDQSADSQSAWIENSKLPTSKTLSSADLVSAHGADDDFIAAARHASYAASQSAVPGFTATSANTARKPEIKAAVPLPNIGPAGRKAPPPIKPDVNSKSSTRRALILAGFVVMAAAAAYFAYNKPKAKSTMIPATIENHVAVNTELAPNVAAAPADTADSTRDEILTASLPQQNANAPAVVVDATSAGASNGLETKRPSADQEALLAAATDGDSSAQFILATRFFDGDGVERDAGKAAYWYHKAALAGSAPAQYRLATQFERGLGVPKNALTALSWYQRAAELGNVKAMHNAAVISTNFDAGKPNFEISHKWFLAAATRGLKDSQFNLAVMYERGIGTKADVNEALFWYFIAANQNDADAQARIESLSQKLAPSTVATIREKAKSWVPLKALTSANMVAMVNPIKQNETIVRQVTPDSPAVTNSIFFKNPITMVQELLKKLGFNIGNADGKLNPRTSNAIRLFQLQSGTKVTGEITDDLISQLQAKLG